MSNQDDPVNVGFPPASRTQLVAEYKRQAEEAYQAGRPRLAVALIGLTEATIRGEGGEAAFAAVRTASLVEPR